MLDQKSHEVLFSVEETEDVKELTLLDSGKDMLQLGVGDDLDYIMVVHGRDALGAVCTTAHYCAVLILDNQSVLALVKQGLDRGHHVARRCADIVQRYRV